MSVLSYGIIARFFEPCIEFNYDPNGLTWSLLFMAVDFIWPWTVWGGTMIMSLIMRELFCIIIVLAISADWFVNFGLLLAVGPSNNIQPPPSICPIPKQQMPSYTSEFIILVWTLLFGLIIILYPRPLPMALITTLVVMSQIVVYGRIYLIFSTPSQLIAGAAVGFIEGTVYLVLIALMRHYKFDRLLIAAPSIFGYRFRDTIMYPNEPTLDTTRLPDKVVFKVYGNDDLSTYDELENVAVENSQDFAPAPTLEVIEDDTRRRPAAGSYRFVHILRRDPEDE